MADLVVTVADVRELGDKLRFLAAEFEDAGGTAEDYADEVCHGDLKHELNQFADNWRVHRGRLMENLRKLAEQAHAAGETYEGLETELVNALEGEG
ncbi:hypothetical protein [Streptomyces hoynatensis]|uniref:PE domain-containing protein n=1 Tax=Streptomyces hoynatensis TaxID=1141874 RepID=A0A3A9ZB48_9ACTN|nr:hypothetical protein [Streptomyces hoynatensis]RKN45551.1 hypothetical protein D7294_03455 [Streptomyces hoynatensis]